MNMLYDSEAFVVVHFQSELPSQGMAVGSSRAASQIQVDPAAGAIPSDDAQPAVGAPRLARNGFEIVDKRSGREIYLDGSWAEMFQQQIAAWQVNTPTQEEVEDTLDRYASLAQQPVTVH